MLYFDGDFRPPTPMIVKCEQCQTRFKIPDERVTDKGVKVRCTKCQHTFRVTREMGQPAGGPTPAPPRNPPPPVVPPPRASVAPAPAAGSLTVPLGVGDDTSDPFARFGAASDPSSRDPTRPGVFALGVEASKVPDLPPPPEPIRHSPPSAKPFDFGTLAPSAPAPVAPPPRSSSPVPPLPVAAKPAQPFDFAGLSPQPSPPSPKHSPGPSPFDFSALGPGPASSGPRSGATGALSFELGSLGPSNVLPPPPPSTPGPKPEPAFDFSNVLPGAATQRATPAFDFSNVLPGSGAASPTAATTKAAAFEPPPTPAQTAASRTTPAFDFSSNMSAAPTSAVEAFAPPNTPAAVAAQRQPLGFDFSALGPPPSSTAATTKAAAFEPGTGQAPAFDFAAMAPSAPTANRAGVEPGAGPLFADVPDLNEPSAAPGTTTVPPNVPDDFFGTPLSPPPSSPGAYKVGASKEELFDMPVAPPVPDPSAPPAPTVAVAPVAMSAPRPANAEASPEQLKRRSALGVVVNLAIAVVLVAALVVVGSALLNDGKLDASVVSPARLKALISHHEDFEASDISNGLYETRRGKPVFFVRGEVTNRASAPARVRVRAEILDGETIVRTAEVVAGTPPTPEQLNGLTGAEEVERLLVAASKTAPPLAPGESGAFVVTFFEYPPDLKAFRVRVSARADPGETAAR